jgi:hypothetical protein
MNLYGAANNSSAFWSGCMSLLYTKKTKETKNSVLRLALAMGALQA